MFAIAGVAINQGDLNRILYGQDALGNWCNSKNSNTSDFSLAVDTVGKRYLYYFYPLDGSSLNYDSVFSTCITECPTTIGEPICWYNVTAPVNDSVALGQLVQEGKCTISIPSKPVLNRCVPQFIVDATGATYSTLFNGSTVTVNGTSYWNNVFYTEFSDRTTPVKVFQDAVASWKWILVGAAVAIAVAFLWLTLIQYCGGWILCLCIVAALGTLSGCAAYCIINSNWVRDANSTWTNLGFNSIGSLTANETVLLVLGILCGVLAVLLLLALLFFWKRIRLAIVVVQQASKAMRSLPTIILLPVAQAVAIGLLCAWVIYIWALCATAGKEIGAAGSATINGITTSFTKNTFQPNTVLMGFTIYYLFGLLWSYNVIIAVCQCTVAGAISVWYWTRKNTAKVHNSIWRAFYYCFRFHFGSLVLGALLVGIVQFIRCILAYLQAQAEKSQNKFAKYVFCCLQCCCGCVEFLVKYVNKNAYIQIAVNGYSYCKAARKAFTLIAGNFLRLFVLSNVIDLFIFLGKLGVSAVAAMVTLKLVESEVSSSVSTYVVPTFISFFIAYFIATVFFSVLSLATSTIFVCFCEDCTINDGSPEKPYAMPKALEQFTDKHSAKRDAESAPKKQEEMSEAASAPAPFNQSFGNMR